MDDKKLTLDDFRMGYAEGMRGHEILEHVWDELSFKGKTEMMISWVEGYLDDMCLEDYKTMTDDEFEHHIEMANSIRDVVKMIIAEM